MPQLHAPSLRPRPPGIEPSPPGLVSSTLPLSYRPTPDRAAQKCGSGNNWSKHSDILSEGRCQLSLVHRKFAYKQLGMSALGLCDFRWYTDRRGWLCFDINTTETTAVLAELWTHPWTQRRGQPRACGARTSRCGGWCGGGIGAAPPPGRPGPGRGSRSRPAGCACCHDPSWNGDMCQDSATAVLLWSLYNFMQLLAYFLLSWISHRPLEFATVDRSFPHLVAFYYNSFLTLDTKCNSIMII